MRNYLLDITQNGLKGKKRSSICLFVACFLSITFAILNVSITGSLNKTRKELRYDMYGEWNVAVYSQGSLEAGLQEGRIQGIQGYGTATAYGNLVGRGATPLTGIGTIDGSLRTLGRLEVESGKFPTKDNEIAIEADVLSSLGYSYELGQELTIWIMDKEAIERQERSMVLRDGSALADGDVTVKKFILCGVLREYTGLWDTGALDVPLVGACVTEHAAKEIGAPWTYQYFMSAEPEESHSLYQYLRREYDTAVENNSAYGAMAKEDYHYLNLALILMITIAAVVVIYSVQFKEQMRSIQLFRTIGATKKQISAIIFYETVIILLPAAGAGIAAGGLATWALLRILMEQGSAFYISIPAGITAGILLLWFGAVFATRFLIFRYSLRGRLSAGNRLFHWAGRKRGRALLGRLLLSSAGMLAVIFCYMESLLPIYIDNLWAQLSSYTLHMDTGQDGMSVSLITDGFLKYIKSLPGIEETEARYQDAGTLEFLGMEENPFAALLMGHRYGAQPWDTAETGGQNNGPEGLWCGAYGIAEDNWEDLFQYIEGEVDREKFRDGESVFLYLPYNKEEGIELEGVYYQDFGVSIGDTVTVAAYGIGEIVSDGPLYLISEEDMLSFYEQYQEPAAASHVKAEVAGIITADLSQHPHFSWLGTDYYTVIGSNAFARKLTETDQDGIRFQNGVWSNQTYGYTIANVYTGMDAGYFSTDYLMAKAATEHRLNFSNQREENTAYRQEAIQALLHIWVCGICIFLTLALALLNIEMLHGLAQKRSFALLQAIGMPKRKLRARLAAKGLLISVAACLMGHAGYFLYFAIKHIGTYQRFMEEFGYTGTFLELLETQFEASYLKAGWNLPVHLAFCAFGIACLFLLSFLAQNRVLKENIRDSLE